MLLNTRTGSAEYILMDTCALICALTKHLHRGDTWGGNTKGGS